MSGATGTLDVISKDGIKTFSWNGSKKDREAARAAFDSAVRFGGLAVVHDSPGKSHMVSTFDEVLDHEKETGVVSAQVSPQIAGG